MLCLQRRHFIKLASGMLAASQMQPLWCNQVIVVVHRDNSHPIDWAYVNKIYSGALRSWPDGTPVLALDQPEDTELRALFSTQILNRSVANMRALWSQNLFTGRGVPPKVVKLDSDVKRIVSSDKQAIGYIMASQIESNLKVIER